MAPYFLFGCGLCFLFEGCAGLFMPSVYNCVSPEAHREKPWRLPVIGAILFALGVVFISVAFPPGPIYEWVIMLVGLACIIKGSMMMFFPGSLRETPTTISSNPRAWKTKCTVRIVIGLGLCGWSVTLMALSK